MNPAHVSAVGTENPFVPRPAALFAFVTARVGVVLPVKLYRGVPGETFDTKYVPTPPFPVKKSVITMPHLF